jgi:signal transduction histidine kinase
MSLTRKILFLVAGVIALFLTLNLTVLPYVTQRYFFDFLQTFYAETRQNEIDAEILSLIKQFPDDAPELLEKYREIDEDLGKLAAGIETYIDTNPVFSRDSVGKYLEETGVEKKQVEDVIGLNAMSVFLKSAPLGFSFSDGNDPKRQFVMQVLVAMIAINILFVLAVVGFVLYFLRKAFKPIHAVTDTLDNFTTSGGKMLDYQGKDEFRPLVDSLNNLRHRLDHQENIRTQFLTDMSHELKTPMTAIRVYLEGIKDGVIQLNTKNIDALAGELARLTRIVESLMHFQTFESRPTDFRHEKINLIDVFSIVQETHSWELSNHGQSMVYVGPKRATIIFDHDSLVQIFHNVVGNFLRYAGSGTQLRVNFFHESTTDIMIFQDNGRGVTSGDLPYLKEKFYQADKSKSGDVRDRGLWVGLSIIDKIVRDAGGAVDLISAEGEWFTVRIEIPHQKVGRW